MTAKSECGPLYTAWAEANNVKEPPLIDVRIKFYRVSDFNSKDATFHATFCLMMDWEDPSIANVDGKIKWDQHFRPSWEIVNAVSSQVVGGMSKGTNDGMPLPRYKRNNSDSKKFTPFGPEHRVTLTVKYKVTLSARLDFRYVGCIEDSWWLMRFRSCACI